MKLTKTFCLELAMGRNLAEMSAKLLREEIRTQTLIERMALVEADIEKLRNAPVVNMRHWIETTWGHKSCTHPAIRYG